jgi:cell division protein FtsB
MREREFQKERIAFLEKQIVETEHSIDIKRKFLNKLNTNPAFLERVAREKLKYVRPGETVIQIEEPSQHSE